MKVTLADGRTLDVTPATVPGRILVGAGWDDKSWADLNAALRIAGQQIKHLEAQAAAGIGPRPGEAVDAILAIIKTLEVGQFAAEWAMPG